MVKSVVAFDIGNKRVGVAFCDPFGEYAIPSDTYFRTGDAEADARALVNIAEGRAVETIVCGLPLNTDGTESEQTARTKRFASVIASMTAIPVVFEDERYTTREARHDLVSMGISAKKDKKKKNVDSLAAAYILESYLAKLKKENVNMSYKEEENDYEEDNIVEIIDEEGKTYRFEHLMTFEYKGEWYCAMTPEVTAEEAESEEDDEDGEIVIYHIVGDEDDEQLEIIEDEEFLDEVFAEFCKQYEDFEDDDAYALEPDEEDDDK